MFRLDFWRFGCFAQTLCGFFNAERPHRLLFLQLEGREP